jgi:hypothetical protein
VEQALSSQIESQIRNEFEAKSIEEAVKMAERESALELESKKLQSAQKSLKDTLQKEVDKAVDVERVKIVEEAKESFELKFKSLQEENVKTKSVISDLKRKEVEMMEKEADLKSRTEELELQLRKDMIFKTKEIEEKGAAREREKFGLEKKQMEMQLAELKAQGDEFKRKADKGSQQLQGEVQEIALEELLRDVHRFDSVVEVPKGTRGADCIQTVVNTMQQECGTIVYESKRTQNYSKDWVEKLKNDQVKCTADVAVLVTETLPNGMTRFGEVDGVWVCTFNEVAGVSMILRDALIRVKRVQSSNVNKGDKMELLYSYLTSNEFVQIMEVIHENYNFMREQLDTEKRAMTKQWKKREKQIWSIQENMSSLFGSIKGIAGNALPNSGFLELPEGEDDA